MNDRVNEPNLKKTPAIVKEASTIRPPKFGFEKFTIIGAAPLVIHRFSSKIKEEMRTKMQIGKASGSRKNREAKDFDAAYNAARYISKEG